MGKKKSKPNPSKQSPPWIELPSDVTANILQRLGAIEILECAQKVCTTWRAVCKEPAMWRVVELKKVGYVPYNLEIMCRHAVDRSQGQLVDINIENFGTDELLQYISQRSNQLRRLRMVGCSHISGKILSEAVARFPNLEELQLFFMSSLSSRDIQSIGCSCPKLKSFTWNNSWFCLSEEMDNEYAHAVAENMQGLRHLRLSGNKMTNDGLQAIP